ncbi:STM3941 family protein [Oceanirhabdus seepicola]|uniref:Uncharacterized protein n=1 Tax=Oceanirhabdus seepicola TaxID=2828781 RepID=A0A9J6NX97_9CLOT|nr:STM3941 family protein [Oceanirhabdus seepicola]MCM1988622.1 hypothetical protein [Oceanirhabdus seepicola]
MERLNEEQENSFYERELYLRIDDNGNYNKWNYILLSILFIAIGGIIAINGKVMENIYDMSFWIFFIFFIFFIFMEILKVRNISKQDQRLVEMLNMHKVCCVNVFFIIVLGLMIRSESVILKKIIGIVFIGFGILMFIELVKENLYKDKKMILKKEGVELEGYELIKWTDIEDVISYNVHERVCIGLVVDNRKRFIKKSRKNCILKYIIFREKVINIFTNNYDMVPEDLLDIIQYNWKKRNGLNYDFLNKLR